jgi:putative DNA primase/helicase
MTARFLYGEFFSFTPTFKIWMATNHKPVIKGTDYGIWRRIKLIPFTTKIEEKKQDKELEMKLRNEASAS